MCQALGLASDMNTCSAFIWDDQTDSEIAVDQVRFGIGTRQHGLLSAEWLCGTLHKGKDFFLTSRGLSQGIKATFHRRDIVMGLTSEYGAAQRRLGFLKPGESRQRTVVPIQPEQDWIAAHIDFLYGTLRPLERAMPLRADKAISLVSPSAPNHLTRIFIVHSYGQPGQLILDGDVTPEPIAGLNAGDRYLRFFVADIPVDWKKHFDFLEAQIRHPPPHNDMRETAERGDLSAVIWGSNGKRLVLREVHSIIVDEQSTQNGV